MKEYRLVTWPQLRPPFDRIAFRRMLSDMSHRHVTVAQLVGTSGVRRQTVRQFLEKLETGGCVVARDVADPDSLFGSLRPLGGWLKRTLARPQNGH
ncbi:MAG: hypothetical protein ABIP61_07825 [Burkholderiaceae bacterium]